MSTLTWSTFLVYEILGLILISIFGTLIPFLDFCYVDRFSSEYQKGMEQDFWSSPVLSSAVFNLTQFLLICIFLQLIFWKSKRTSTNNSDNSLKINWAATYACGITIFWYGSTYLLCYALKIILGDSTCHEHPNSVSGHYCFHVFYILSTLFLIVQLERDPQALRHYSGLLWQDFNSVRSESKLLIMTYVVFVCCSLFTLSRTWIFGYHSLRQILYGVILALLSNLGLSYIFSPKVFKYSIWIALAYGILSFSIYPLYLSRITTEFPLSVSEIVIFLGAISLSFISSRNFKGFLHPPLKNRKRRK